MVDLTLAVPREYGYVLVVAASSSLVGLWHAIRTGPFRRAARVSYPQQYVVKDKDQLTKEEYLFNCAQRAHINYLENLQIFLPVLMISGLRYPLAGAGLGAAWLVQRLIYATGYTRKDKADGSGRLLGSGFWVCQLVLALMAGKTGYDVVMR